MSETKSTWKRIVTFPVKGMDGIDTASGFIMAIIVAFLMLSVTVEVIARYVYKPTPGHVELVRIIIPVIAFLGVAYAQSFAGHIRVEILLLMLKGRVYHFTESLWLFLSLGIFIILTIIFHLLLAQFLLLFVPFHSG